jgi:hypothetical protein
MTEGEVGVYTGDIFFIFHMKYRNTIIALGFLVFITHIFGLPSDILNALYILEGMLIVVFGYLSGRKPPVSSNEIPTTPVSNTQA